MKKILLFLGFAGGIISNNASAQMALENFNGAGLPAGWVLINDGNTVSTLFTSVPGLPATLTANAWAKVHSVAAAGDSQMISTSYFNPAATADRWLITPAFTVSDPKTVFQWYDYNLNSGEGFEVKVSPTAGTTAVDFTSTLYSGPAAGGALTKHQAPVGSYNGTSIRAAFHENTNDGWGMVVDNVQTAIIDSIDLGITAINLPGYLQTGTSYPVIGTLHNYAYNTTTSVNINYSISGGATVTSPLTGLSVALGANYSYTSGTPWVPPAAGTYTVKVWADNINGGIADQVHTNDTLVKSVVVVDSVQPKTVMIEEFTQASCDPCAQAHTNVDSVYANNLSRSVLLRYHVNFPGRDCMDTVTLASFVSGRLAYYGVTGVPDAQVDGTYVYPGAGGLSSGVIAASAFNNSPFKITVNATFNSSTQTFSFTSDIKSFAPLAAGIKAYACLVEDTLTYAANQSTESIPQTIFPQVAENMFPNANGTTLTAFTAGSTQSLNLSWVKSHPWGSSRAIWSYDSTSTGRIIVWVESPAKYVYQAASAPVYTAHTVGVNAVTVTNGSMDVYPNPASRTATVALNLKTGADVKLEVYNMAGQLVYSVPAEHRNSGTSASTIDVSNLASGTYLVKVSIGDELLNKTLTVAK